MKITKVQRRVLQTMIDAETTVMTISGQGRRKSAFFVGIDKMPERKRVRVTTLRALAKKGLIEDISRPAWWHGGQYGITDKGREAVQ